MRTLPALVLVVASAASAIAAGRQAIDISRYTIVDLSHAYGPSTVMWPTSPTKFELNQLSFGMTEGGYFYAANSLATPEHGGTHLDAPIHFSQTGRTAEQIPLEQLIAPAPVTMMRRPARLKAGFIAAPRSERGRRPYNRHCRRPWPR